MGLVYEAEHVSTGKRVAIKWLHPHVMESRSAVERLVREAQASARVRHSNVVDIYDVERDGETVFLVMEYLEGETLSAVLERGGMPISELLALIVQAMRGVAEAHRQGVVHRDIKPDNIFLAYEPDRALPIAKVLDFGISKIDAPAGGVSLTQTGSALGTPLYMSYEQLSGMRDVDARSDVYAFGVILYEALTGHLPYLADNFAELAAKVITTEPAPLRELRPDVPEELERIVMQAIRKRREERIASLGILIDALAPYATPSDYRATPLPSARLSAASIPVRAATASQPVSSAQPPLRLDDEWGTAFDRSERAHREMEERVTALIAGTMPEYAARKRRTSSRGRWMAIGALTTLIGGLGLAMGFRDDLSGAQAAADTATRASERATEAPAPAAVANAPTLPPASEAQADAQATAAPTQVEPVRIAEPPSAIALPSTLPAEQPLAAEAPTTQAASSPATPAAAATAPATPAHASTHPRRAAARPRFDGPSGELTMQGPIIPAGETLEAGPDAPSIPTEPAAPPQPVAPVAAPPMPPPAQTEPSPAPSPYDDDPVAPSPYDEPVPELRHRAGSPQADEF